MGINHAKAQEYLQDATQHRFAQTYFGINGEYTPAAGSFIAGNETIQFNEKFAPRVSIGGIHFWGRLDFNVNFALPVNTSQKVQGDQELIFVNMGDFNAKYYPWQIKYKALRPYFGFGLNYLFLNVKKEALNRSENYMPIGLIGGVSYNTKNWQIFVEGKYLVQSKHTIYNHLYEQQNIQIPNTFFYLGISKFFDTTLKEEKPKKTGKLELLENEFPKASKLNSFSIGIGGNTSYFIKQPIYSDNEQASLPKLNLSNNLDLGLGYFFHKSNIHIGLAFRNYSISSESYNYEHVLRRNSIALEAHKQLFNWNGFAPYVGPSFSYERWATAEFVNDETGTIYRTKKLSPGIIFGWDILASKFDSWVLRTNMRYYPYLTITDALGQESRVDQLEMNFIQAVFYPERMIRIAKAKKRIGFYN